MLLKKKITSNASKNLYYFKTLYLTYIQFKKLKYGLIYKAGRTQYGKMLLTKKKRNKFISYYFNKHLRYSNVLGFIISFSYSFLYNKIFELIFLVNGVFFYKISTQDFKLFSFFFFDSNFWLYKYWLDTNLFLLLQIDRFQLISNLELYPGKGIQYIRASGVKGKVLSLNYNLHKTLILLPSGLKKFISFYSFILKGPVTFRLKSKLGLNKAGYARNKGRGIIVRGIAKNPIDHPHGGRTNSIKNQRTPWGKVTKYS